MYVTLFPGPNGARNLTRMIPHTAASLALSWDPSVGEGGGVQHQAAECRRERTDCGWHCRTEGDVRRPECRPRVDRRLGHSEW